MESIVDENQTAEVEQQQVPVAQADTIAESAAETSVETAQDTTPAPAKKRRKRRVIAQPESPVAPEGNHCPACVSGQSLEKGEGTHLLLTIEHPYDPHVPEIPREPLPKSFGKALEFAEKELSTLIKKKQDAIDVIVAADRKIPQLIDVIKALGGTPPTAVAATNAVNQGTNYPMPVQQVQAPGFDPMAQMRTAQLPDILRAGAVAETSTVTGAGWV